MSIHRRGESEPFPAGFPEVLEVIALQAIEAKNTLDQAEYRFSRVEEFTVTSRRSRRAS